MLMRYFKLCSCLAGTQCRANVEVERSAALSNRRRNMMARMSAMPSVPQTRAAGAPVPERSLATGMLPFSIDQDLHRCTKMHVSGDHSLGPPYLCQ